MHNFSAGLIAVALLAATGCGKRDASGIYVAVTDQTVTLVQLVQSPDGKLIGRIQESKIVADGTVKETSLEADGSISGQDLLLSPKSVWFGGVQASGTVSGNKLTLVGTGYTLTAQLSSFQKYQDAVEHLRSVGADYRQQIADTQAAEASAKAKAKAERDLANKQAEILEVARLLRAETAKLIAEIKQIPNFGQDAAANTAHIVKMLQIAPTLSGVEIGQLSVAASQVEIDTYQIEVARSQYAIGLDQILRNAGRLAAELEKMCTLPYSPQFTMQCKEAKPVIPDFKEKLKYGQEKFMPHRQQVKIELDRQKVLIRKIDDRKY